MDLDELLADDDQYDVENALFDPEEFDATADLLRGEISELRRSSRAWTSITGEDTKATRLVSDINEAFNTYASVVVFTQYTDTLDYFRDQLITAGYHAVGCYSGRGGEVCDPATQDVGPVSPRPTSRNCSGGGDITILLGTDAMSEGLNLQTCGRLINYDMPWNLMRVEQRIGRIDRIGATLHARSRSPTTSTPTRSSSASTKASPEDYGDFTDIVGNAQPVLGTIEKTIEQLALADTADQGTRTGDAVGEIKNDLADLAARPVQTSDLGDTPEIIGHIDRPPTLSGSVTLADLEATLTSNGLTRDRFTPVDGRPGVYRLALPEDDYAQVSF